VALTELLDRVLLSPPRWYRPSPVHWSVLGGLAEDENYDLANAALSYPVDFLGSAAYSGIRLYVLQILDSEPTLRKSYPLRNLLYCVIGQQFSDELEVQHLRLISALLERGAPPNSVSGITSAWHRFLG